jgi:cytochrome c-type biogenesis protein CcmH
MLLLLTLVLGPVPHAYAIQPEEQLKNPVLEARARALSKELRCLVCEDESIDASHAELASDIRRLIRQRILAGDSDRQIKQFLVQRYGDYILFKPPFNPRTALLWIGPFVFLVLAGAILVLRGARKEPEPPLAPLSPEEESEIAALAPSAPPPVRDQGQVTKN